MTRHDEAPYFDFLGVLSADLSDVRLIVVHGRSGTGKSTALERLFRSHPRFAGSTVHTVRPADHAPLPNMDGAPVIVDEVLTPRDLPTVLTLLRRGHMVGVASHVPPFVYTPLRIGWRMRSFSTNRDDGKLAWELERLGVAYSRDALQRFRRRFGANFVDLRLVLERSPGRSLDEALHFFQRFCDLRTQRIRRNGHDRDH